MKKKAIFIASTGQHVGKTTLCLGLLAGLKKRFERVGFIKPVGQEHVEVENGLHVDKDVVLFKEHFHLKSAYELMSPVIIPSGFTRRFLDEEIHEKELVKKIKKGFKTIYTDHDFTLVEGTGHVGVGSIVNLSNARVAELLNLEVILVVSGGLGSAFDLLSLNKALLDQHGVKLKGVIVNRVISSKREMIKNYMTKALKAWKVPLLGCIPFDPVLSNPTMRDFEILFSTHLLTGHSHRLRHFKNLRLVATSLKNYNKLILPSQLIITPANREEIILATLAKYWDMKVKDHKSDLESGMILIGDTPPRHQIIQEIKKADIPMLYVPLSSTKAMEMIASHTAKISLEDEEKVHEAIQVIENYVDFTALC
jgi:phosphate acetyltransferase